MPSAAWPFQLLTLLSKRKIPGGGLCPWVPEFLFEKDVMVNLIMKISTHSIYTRVGPWGHMLVVPKGIICSL